MHFRVSQASLSKSLPAGDQGLPFNPGAAFALISHAASQGDPEAQRNVGLFQAAGIRAPASNATHKREILAPPLQYQDYFQGRRPTEMKVGPSQQASA